MLAERCAPKTLILGIGNLLMDDEGVGVHVVRYLQQNAALEGVDVLDGGMGGFLLLESFERYDHLFLVDATMDARAPGTVCATEPKVASDFPSALTTPDIGLKDLLNAAMVLGLEPQALVRERSTGRTTALARKRPQGVELRRKRGTIGDAFGKWRPNYDDPLPVRMK
jgi:hydrogenase maturation protease